MAYRDINTARRGLGVHPHSIRRTPLLILGIRSLESFKVNDLVTYRAVTSEQDPLTLWAFGGSLLYTLAPSLLQCTENLNRLALPRANG